MLKDKIKALVAKGEKGDSKKKIENLVVFLVILIVTIIIAHSIYNSNVTNIIKKLHNIYYAK